jgi:hypothetical protein
VTRYQHIATEVLSSDMDAFVDACLQNDSELLKSLWSRVIRPKDEPRDAVTISQFCKVFVSFLVRKPHKVIQHTFSFVIAKCWFPDIRFRTAGAKRSQRYTEAHRDAADRGYASKDSVTRQRAAQ